MNIIRVSSGVLVVVTVAIVLWKIFAGNGPDAAVPAGNTQLREASRPAPVAPKEEKPLVFMSPPGEPVVAMSPEDDPIGTFIRRMQDAAIPLETREQELRAMAERRDETAKATLMSLSEANIHLSPMGLEFAGAWSDSELIAFAVEKTKDGNAQLAAAAMRSLSLASAITELDLVMRTQRSRPDGQEQFILEAAVEAIAASGNRVAAPLLERELTATDAVGMSLSYGRTVVDGLIRLGSSTSRPALEAYAQRLEGMLPSVADNPQGIAAIKSFAAFVRLAAKKMSSAPTL